MEQKISNKSQLREWLRTERKLYLTRVVPFGGSFRESQILWKHQRFLRITEYHINSKHKLRALLWRTKLQKIQNRYSLHIPVNTCGKGFHIMHLGPILINGNAKIGNNCVVHINVGIVAGGTSDKAPHLGDNIVVGMGAVVLGNIVLADSIAIGANALVNKSFKERDITIAGVPAKKVSDCGRSKWFQKSSNGTATELEHCLKLFQNDIIEGTDYYAGE